MTLAEVFEHAVKDGFTHANDEYSYRGRNITNWKKEIENDKNNYEYCTDGLTAWTNQIDNDSNRYHFWGKK